MYRFQHIENLFGLAAIPFLVIVFLAIIRWKKNTTKKLGDPKLVALLVDSYSSLKFSLKFILGMLALAIIITGAANIQQPGKMEDVNRRGVDVMLVLDVSKSMLAEDIKPSRLEKAKQLLLRLMDKLQNDRVGLVLFAGRAYIQMPLTIDHSAAKMYIQEAGPLVVPTQGTVIAEALQMANSSFNTKERKYKSMVLISDGEDHDPNALKTVQKLAENGVIVNAIGIGSPDGSTIIDPETHDIKKDAQGNPVISKLNETELKQLADASKGIYLRLDNLDDAVITLSQQIAGTEQKSVTDTEFVNYKSFFQYFLGAALFLLLLEFFMTERKRALA